MKIFSNEWEKFESIPTDNEKIQKQFKIKLEICEIIYHLLILK